ncbi:MAG: hypothetical protein JWN81_1148 [Solirubrobacterales bacterium]|jgi:hypothetical protein|nr:hypothetical protein [Solirubrobacterales bacterium]
MTTVRSSHDLYGAARSTNVDDALMNENFSLIVMCLFLLASLAFLAQQLTSYH